MEQRLNLDLSKYVVLDPIGSGSFGCVYLVQSIKTNKLYAAKESKVNIEDDPDFLDGLLREIKIIAQLNHPSIVEFIGFNRLNFENEQNPVIITNYYPEGSLEELIEKSNKSEAPPEFDDTQKLIILYGIASAMKYLHKCKIIHRDLKPANILLDENLNPKICDFGLSIPKQEEHCQRDIIGTPLYISPEIYENSDYSTKGDVYAFAFIVYELILNVKPFKGESQQSIFCKVQRGIRPKFTQPIGDSYKNLINKCWSQDRNQRPSFKEIVIELKNDSGFITDSIDEARYFNYVNLIDETPVSINPLPEFDKKDIDKLDPETMFLYAQNQEIEGNLEEARKYYKKTGDLPTTNKKLSDPRNTIGMINYARCCEKGIGGPVDLDQFVLYIKKAADSNNSEAQFRYGLMLESGKIVEQNLKEAAKYFLASSILFNFNGMMKYVNCVANGIGVEKNIFKALKSCKRFSYIRKESNGSNILMDEDISTGKKMYDDLLKHLNDDDNGDESENNENDDEKLSFDNTFITFKNIKYKYDKVSLLTRRNSEQALYYLNKDKNDYYPQGFENCTKILEELRNGGFVLVFYKRKNHKWTQFYFPYSFDEGHHVWYPSDLQVEIDIINTRKERDIYPQGMEYCLDLLANSQSEKKSVHILSKKISHSSRVVFMHESRYHKKSPFNKKCWEDVYYLNGNEEIENQITEFENQSCEFKPSYEICQKVIQYEKDRNGALIAISNYVYDLSINLLWCFYSTSLFERICEEEWWIKGEKRLRDELNKVVNSEEKEFLLLPTHENLFPQGKENCIKIIEEQIEAGGGIHIGKRKNNYSCCCWFYFKA